MNKLYYLNDFQSKFVYRVERGDDLNSLSDKFHTAPSRIIADNSLNEEISEGELLVIEKVDGEEYIVKPYDDLDKIAGYDEKKRREIVAKNKTDYIYVGQKIYI